DPHQPRSRIECAASGGPSSVDAQEGTYRWEWYGAVATAAAYQGRPGPPPIHGGGTELARFTGTAPASVQRIPLLPGVGVGDRRNAGRGNRTHQRRDVTWRRAVDAHRHERSVCM